MLAEAPGNLTLKRFKLPFNFYEWGGALKTSLQSRSASDI